MGESTKAFRLKVLRETMAAAHARGDTKTVLKVNRAIERLQAKHRPKGTQPGSRQWERDQKAAAVLQKRIDAATVLREARMRETNASLPIPIEGRAEFVLVPPSPSPSSPSPSSPSPKPIPPPVPLTAVPQPQPAQPRGKTVAELLQELAEHRAWKAEVAAKKLADERARS